MVAVLGSIFAGMASPTEAAGVGAVGATLLTIANRKFSYENPAGSHAFHHAADLHGVHHPGGRGFLDWSSAGWAVMGW
jgi:hypothetical protein